MATAGVIDPIEELLTTTIEGVPPGTSLLASPLRPKETLTTTTTPSKCPWGNISANSSPRSDVLNFSDIMDEQLAINLQIEEDSKNLRRKVDVKPVVEIGAEAVEAIKDLDLDTFDLNDIDLEALAKSNENSTDISSDFLIAQMLQLQFNKEFDEGLKKFEESLKGASKVPISLGSIYMTSKSYSLKKNCLEDESDSDAEDYDDDDYEPKRYIDSFEEAEKTFPSLPKSGFVKINNEVLTKHDINMCDRRNACRVMETLSLNLQTGDGGGFDMKLSNKVYNTLKVYSKAEDQRRSRIHDKSEKSTSEMAIDSKTRLLLYKMVNNQIFDKVYGIISTGKESIVLYATGGNLDKESEALIEVPPECAVKVFKTSLNEFKTRDRYIKDDYRFKDRFSKLNPRKIIHLWAEKEMHNLTRMRKASIPCPQVVLLKKHILVLGFIGKDMKPAPKLKDVKFPHDDNNELLRKAYNQVVDGMRKLYSACNLIHSDLSEYNVLWHDETCHFIDVSQSIEPNHPHALEFLYRDCKNICTFFGKRGLSKIETPSSLFTSICGFKLEGSSGAEAEILNQIQDFERNLELLTLQRSEKNYPFDFCWEREHDGDGHLREYQN